MFSSSSASVMKKYENARCVRSPGGTETEMMLVGVRGLGELGGQQLEGWSNIHAEETLEKNSIRPKTDFAFKWVK